MTTPAEEAGNGRSEAPYLPHHQAAKGSAEPTEPKIRDALYVPGSEEPRPVFDAKALVEAQKPNFGVKPAYGPLPVATDASRAATRELRARARRKRRRDRLLSQAVIILVLGGAVSGGWFGYQAYLDQQDRDAADRALAEGNPGVEDAVASLSPSTEQQGVDEGADDGGDDPDITGEPSTDASVPVAVDPAGPFAARTVDFVYRTWPTASSTSPMIEYFYSYDRVADTYAAEIRPGDGTVTITGTDAGYRYAIYPDGNVDRAPRSAASLEFAPDLTLANVFREDDILPEPARPFAVLEETTLDSGFGDAFTYSIDTELWRTRDPGSYIVWVTRWNSRPADDGSMVDLGRREISTEGPATVPVAPTLPTPAPSGLERDAPGATVTYMVAPEGHVLVATIVDNTADFRTEYYFVRASDTPSLVDLSDRTWVPAP